VDSGRSSSHRSVILRTGGISKPRLFLFQFFLVGLFLTLLFQIAQLSLFHHSLLVEKALNQFRLTVDIPPLRGSILDRNGKGLAINLKVPSIYAVPRAIRSGQKAKLVNRVAQILSLPPGFVSGRLDRDKAFVWLKRRVSAEEAREIEKLNHSGLGILYEYKRFYPHGTLGANLVGFTNVDNEGIEGIERMEDSRLRGKAGKRFTRRDALGREIKAFEERMIPALDGHRIVLTVDQYLQYVTERALDRAFRKWKAKGATAILMNPHTGEILAMAVRPTFDPNSPGDFPAANYRNRVLTDVFEPGSVFKIVTAAAVLSERKVNLTERINCEQGEWSWGLKTLHDVHEYGFLTFPEVIVKSSNIGTVKLALRLGPDTLQRYIQMFGFGKKTGIDLEGEVSGFVRPAAKWSKTSPYAIPIGQEVTTTTLQLARAISLIANGGYLVQPHLIDRIEDVHGITLQKKTFSKEGPKLEPAVVEVLKEVLWRATEEGTGKNARVKGIPVAGKTGTAQKILGRGYSHSNFISSFIGFAPADNPLLAMVVLVDDPRPLYYGGTVAAPVFSEVMEAALAHLGYAQP